MFLLLPLRLFVFVFVVLFLFPFPFVVLFPLVVMFLTQAERTRVMCVPVTWVRSA